MTAIYDQQEAGKRLIQVQELLNKNSRTFALEMGGDPSYMGKMEKGTKSISKTYLRKMESVHGVNPDWVLWGEGQPFVEKHGQNVPHETDALLKKVLTIENNGPILPAGDLSMQAIVNLTQSNRTLAESNRILATSHQELVEMVKSATADAGPKTTVDDLSRSRDFLAIIAELGVGKLWKSKQEALAKLNKFFAEPEKSNA